MTFAQTTRKKTFFSGDERVWIAHGRAEFDHFAVDEVADFDRSNRRLREIGDDAKANRSIFAPIIVNEDRAAVTVDLTRPVAHAHANRDSLPIANEGAPVRLPADLTRPSPVDMAKDA